VKIVSEAEFAAKIRETLTDPGLLFGECDFVTGPGRSGAIAAVYASHILRIPFIPAGADPPARCNRLLVIDTAAETGATLRKAMRRYAAFNPYCGALYMEPPRVAFWYEAAKPQSYKHEDQKAPAICVHVQAYEPGSAALA
jgi:hypothetical protein